MIMRYLRVFNTNGEFDAAVSIGDVAHNSVILIRGGSEIKYFPQPEADVPIYIEALEDLTVSFSAATQYSLNNNDWTSLAKSTATPTITAGSKVYFRASGLTTAYKTGLGTFSISGRCNVGGNAMSLVYGSNYVGQTLLEKDYALSALFINQTNLVDASKLSLPATTLAPYCYRGMFYGCTSLVNAPALPATTLSMYCYSGMFYNCTSLVNAPALPATTLAEGCYGDYANWQSNYQILGMFSGCTSLVNAPALPATTLAPYCYIYMFRGCTSLVNAPALPATTLATCCYVGTFYGCTSLVNAPTLPATTLVEGCYGGGSKQIGSGSVTGLAGMFYNCSNLSYVKAMFITKPSDTYTYNWLKGVAAKGVFVKNAAATWNVTGVNGIPSGWTVELADA